MCQDNILSTSKRLNTHRDIHYEGKNQSQYKCTLQLSLLQDIEYRILFYDIYINHAFITTRRRFMIIVTNEILIIN